jgi:hypothetical protein
MPTAKQRFARQYIQKTVAQATTYRLDTKNVNFANTKAWDSRNPFTGRAWEFDSLEDAFTRIFVMGNATHFRIVRLSDNKVVFEGTKDDARAAEPTLTEDCGKPHLNELPKRTTSAQDAAFLSQRFADFARTWKVGDACASFTNGRRPDTTVASIDGDRVKLTDGSGGHISKMRRPQNHSYFDK